LVRPSRATLGRPSSTEAQTVFDTRKLKTKIYAREELRSKRKYSGPAVITEYSATTVVPPHSTFYLDKAANLIVTP
jgi:N-methylhydantoinase A